MMLKFLILLVQLAALVSSFVCFDDSCLLADMELILMLSAHGLSSIMILVLSYIYILAPIGSRGDIPDFG